MEKYATYRIFKNKQTGEIKRIQLSEENSMDKVASLKDEKAWVELDTDPENNAG